MHAVTDELKRDEKGRPIADDGYPMNGMAHITEAIAFSGLSRSKLYSMMKAGELPTRQYGRTTRISWKVLREFFGAEE